MGARRLLLDDLLAGNAARAASGDEADLLTGGVHAAGGRGVANVLVVAATVGVLHGVHGATAHLGPRVALHAVLVEGAARLEKGFVQAPAAGHNADHGAAVVEEGALRARGQAHAGGALLEIVGHDGGVVAARPGDLATVAGGLLHVADEGTLGHRRQGEDVAHHELGLLASVQELTRVYALGAADELGDAPELVRVLELHLGDRRATAGLVHDLWGRGR